MNFLKFCQSNQNTKKYFFLYLFALFFKSMPPYISKNEHHPPNRIKQYHNSTEDRTHMSAQHLDAEPLCLGSSIIWICKVPAPRKKRSFCSKTQDGTGMGCYAIKTKGKALGTILRSDGESQGRAKGTWGSRGAACTPQSDDGLLLQVLLYTIKRNSKTQRLSPTLFRKSWQLTCPRKSQPLGRTHLTFQRSEF